MRQLERYAWPGNVRELRNVIERAVILATGPQAHGADAAACADREPRPPMTLASFELEHIRADAREHQLAHPRGGRRRRASGPQADDARRPRAQAIPKEGYFTLEQGRYGPDLPRTPACHGFTIIAKIKPGTEEEIRAYGKKLEKARRGRPARARAAPAALPPLGALRHRWRHVLHVPGHLRHRLRQVHRGRRRALRQDGHQHDLREARGLSRRTGRRTCRRSSSSSASISARASSSTASIRTSRRSRSRRRSS